MADILIRGMEMPKDCPHCEFAAIGYASPMSSDCTLYCRAVDKFKDCSTEILKDKPYEVISHYNDRPDWCPIVPLPKGHGRLIDADALLEQIRDGFEKAEQWRDAVENDPEIRPRAEATVVAFWECGAKVKMAPTIIEAEGGTYDG